MKQNKSKGMALISLVFALIITGILVVLVLKIYSGDGKEGGVDLQSPIDRGKGVQCLALRRKVDMAIRLYHAQNDKFPSSLSELKGFSDEDFRCPVTGNAYNYNPSTGKLTCPDHP